MTLKLSGADLNEARRQVTAMFDPQTTGVLDLLLRPYAEFFDFADPKSFSALQRICEAEGVRLPAPTDI
jgi:hypothetical protein